MTMAWPDGGSRWFGEGALQQHLREQRLGVDIGAMAEQDEAGERESDGAGEAGHGPLPFVIASQRVARMRAR